MTKKLFFYVPVVIKRIQNEEKVLKQELRGYKEYIQHVHYRLAPLYLVKKASFNAFLPASVISPRDSSSRHLSLLSSVQWLPLRLGDSL